ncbi:PAS domain-containing sensor histidine kinase [Azohydromonas lata]|uniref:PAS domain-containing sensor histidine kinase n=1 Tax=Azohydromonas lata TaxID=45677 RepID=UPI00082AEB03|nr:PAS domain-containing sensor histidine kinase [Azohydromonas lata]
MQPPEPANRPAPAAQPVEGDGTASPFEQLLQRRNQIESILQVVVGDDGVVVQDFTGRIVYANEPAARLLGDDTVTALLRTPSADLLAHLVIHDEAGRDVSGELPGTAILRGSPPGERTLRIRNAAARERWVTVRTLAMRDDRGTVATSVSIFRDVTEQRRTAEFRENLLGIASHDLRNPLSAISTAAAVLARFPDRLDSSTAAKLVRQIQTSTDRATRLVRDLLDLTQAQLGGGIPVARREVDVEALVAGAVEEVTTALPDRTMVLNCSEAGTAYWDPDRISQVLGNLLSNAMTYGTPDKTITVDVCPALSTVAIAVHNHGPAIAADELPRVFEPFMRGVTAPNPQRSVGLGLYVVKEVVAAHGGTVSVMSGPHSGTKFTVILPRQL